MAHLPKLHPGATGLSGSFPRVRSSNVSGLGAFAAIGAAALCLAFSPKVSSDTFTPKFAVVLLFAAVGIVPLARLVRTRSPLRWPARAVVAFLAVALVSALVSPSPNIGIFGLYLWGTGWLLWLGAAGAFAIGASLGPNDRRWLFAGLLVGALGNALVAISQIVGNFQTGGLALFDGTQADGLLGNPIHLEALLLGALALILGRACRSPLRWGAAVLLLAVGLEFTFERFALVILVLLVLYALYSYGARRGGTFALLIGVGYAIAYPERRLGPRRTRHIGIRRDPFRSPASSVVGGRSLRIASPLAGRRPRSAPDCNGLDRDTFILPECAGRPDSDRRPRHLRRSRCDDRTPRSGLLSHLVVRGGSDGCPLYVSRVCRGDGRSRACGADQRRHPPALVLGPRCRDGGVPETWGNCRPNFGRPESEQPTGSLAGGQSAARLRMPASSPSSRSRWRSSSE